MCTAYLVSGKETVVLILKDCKKVVFGNRMSHMLQMALSRVFTTQQGGD